MELNRTFVIGKSVCFCDIERNTNNLSRKNISRYIYIKIICVGSQVHCHRLQFWERPRVFLSVFLNSCASCKSRRHTIEWPSISHNACHQSFNLSGSFCIESGKWIHTNSFPFQRTVFCVWSLHFLTVYVSTINAVKYYKGYTELT